MKKKILVVDDSEFMRMMIKDSLKSLGHDVVAEGSNGNEAIELYNKHKPDLVTMDLVMPEKTGLEALREIVKSDPSAKIIVVSAIDQRETLMEAIKGGACDFIVKPFDEDRIASAIQKALN